MNTTSTDAAGVRPGRLPAALLRPLRYLLDLVYMLRRTGAALWMLLLGLGFIVALPQGREMVRIIGDETGGPHGIANFAWLQGSALLWGLAAWYTARILLGLRRGAERAQEDTTWMGWLRIWLPRGMGALSTGCAGIAAAIMGEGWVAAVNALLALALLVFASRRRQWFAGRFSAEDRAGVPAGRETIDPFAFKVLAASLIASVALLLAFLVSPLALPRHFGAIAVLQFALTGWVIFGNLFLVYWGRLLKLPSLALVLLAVALLTSRCNDNHAIRRFPAEVPADRPTLEQHFRQWVEARIAAGGEARPVPVVIVAAEGGGMRAAYWTAGLLAAIEERAQGRGLEGLIPHLYAISGVSGGAVGGAAFAALLADTPPGTQPRCKTSAGEGNSLRQCAGALFEGDYLSPNMAALLYGDLVQRFLPFPIHRLDRALAMEGGAEAGWEQAYGNRRFSAPMQSLWRDGPGSARVPALFLNATVMESGQRAIASNLKIDGNSFADAHDVFDMAVDETGTLRDRRDMPLITAMHLSARFPYMSPAGTLEKDGRMYAHLVDGGYFENSGATTALEILNAVTGSPGPGRRREAMEGSLIKRRNLRPIVVSIRNEPAQAASCQRDLDQPDPVGPARRALTEYLGPPFGLYATRNARTTYTEGLLVARIRELANRRIQANYVRLCLESTVRHPPPLGWTLARASREDMDRTLARVVAGENPEVERLLDLLAAAR